MVWTAVTRGYRVMTSVAYATFKEWAAYRSHMLVSLFVGPVYFLVQFFIWSAVFHSRDTINGFTLDQMLAYYGVMTLINYLIMDFADWNLQMLIHTGRFLTFMLRPVSHIYFALAQKTGHRILGFCLEFVPVYLMFFFIFGIRLVPANIMWTVLSVIPGFLMMFLVNYSIGITGFWLVRTGGVRRMFLVIRDIFAGTLIPLTFFPDAIQKLLLFLPFQYISYVPARVFSGSYELAGMKIAIPAIVCFQAAAVLGMWIFTLLFWKFGIKKFTGVGA